MTGVVFGAGGQLGRAFVEHLRREGEPVVGLLRADVDICDEDAVLKVLQQQGASILINAAAWTDVDGAEVHQAEAMRVNIEGPEVLARCANEFSIPLVHLSTDYVFDGGKGQPYDENDATNPINVYGHSKLLGEMAVIAGAREHMIFRTSWVHSSTGMNFSQKMLQLMRTQEQVDVVVDQIGIPTWAPSFVDWVVGALRQCRAANGTYEFGTRTGLYHLCSAGHTTWYGFAKAIASAFSPDEGRVADVINPVSRDHFDQVAMRPADTRLDCSRFDSTFRLERSDWESDVKKAIQQLVRMHHG